MNLNRFVLEAWLGIAAVFCCRLFGAPSETTVQPSRLIVEYLESPVGIDNQHPQLSWILQSPERNQRQGAYQVLVAGAAENLAPGKADLWDSGRVDSTDSVHVVYEGKPLSARLIGQGKWLSLKERGLGFV